MPVDLSQLPIPEALYPCHYCHGDGPADHSCDDYTWPADELYWSPADGAWLCDACLDGRGEPDCHEPREVRLSDVLAAQGKGAQMRLEEWSTRKLRKAIRDTRRAVPVPRIALRILTRELARREARKQGDAATKAERSLRRLLAAAQDVCDCVADPPRRNSLVDLIREAVTAHRSGDTKGRDAALGRLRKRGVDLRFAGDPAPEGAGR